MNAHTVPNRAAAGRSAMFVAALFLGFALQPVFAPPQPVADAAAPVPVTVTFEKVAGDDGPYVATVTNTSSDALKVQITVHQSVQSHNRPKDINHPEETIAAGKSTTVKELAAHDKVKVSAEGYSPVETVVPPGKD